MAIRHDQINDYLRRYAATLSHFDAEGAARLWSMPGMIVDDRFSGVVESREVMAQSLEQSYPLYQRLGLDSVNYQVLDEDHLTPAMVLVSVRWTFCDVHGEELTNSQARYLLRVEKDGLRACICIQIDDVEKLQELAAVQGVNQ